jgi:large exoprotein involved in heme utilization and adhesion
VCLGSAGCLNDPAAGKFFANPNAPSVLTVAAPASFGFLGPSTGSITVDSTALSVDPGQTMSFVGGPVQVTGSQLTAPGGRVQLVSVSSAGEVTLPGFNVVGVPGVPVPTQGSITVTGAFIDVSGDAAGTVSIRGGNLVIDSSTILASTGGADGTPVAVDLAATGALTVTNGSTLLSSAGSTGRSGDINLSGGSVEISNGSGVVSSRGGDGASGSITATATGHMLITQGSALVSSADVGDGAPISVTAGSLTVDQGATIQSIAVTGRGGDVVVTAPQLAIQSGAAISTTIVGPGRGGDVLVNSTGATTISGEFTGISTGSFFADPSAPDQGAPGNIVAHLGSLTLTDSATIQSGVLFGSQGGNVSIVATGPISISNRAGIASESFFTNAGTVTISAPVVSIGNGFISTSTLASGRAGDIVISAGALELASGGQIASASIATATGAGGDVQLNLSSALTISGASPTGRSPLPTPFSDFFTDARSGIFTTAAGSGPGGNITIRSPQQIRILNGGTISAASTGDVNATAGNITINFGDRFSMDGSSITTSSTLADGGNIVITSTGSILDLSDSQITTSVQSGVGGGGNITLGTVDHPIGFIVLDNGQIHADAFGGPGGNINIFADTMLSSTPIQTAVTASSALSTPGTINVVAVATDVSGSLPELAANTQEAAALLRASCAARLAEGKTSSLVVAGREGVPLEPGGLMPSGLMDARRVAAAGTVGSFLASEWPQLRLAYLDVACGR